MKAYSPSIEQRLTSRLERRASGCLEFTGAVLATGYGRIARGARGNGYELTHRVAWLAHGPIPDGLFVCHTCDNPPCCEISHLFLGTPADNANDMWRKGRGPAATLIPRGQEHPSARLSNEQVQEMRKAALTIGNYAELGRLFGISKQHARAICLGLKRAA